MIDHERQHRPVGREHDDHARGGMRDVMEWNEEMVRRYDIERFYERSHPLIRWVESRRLKAIAALARPAGPAASVLEVGCGAGHVLERLEQWRRTGVDLSARMLQKTRRRLGGSVRLVQATADRLPFPDSCVLPRVLGGLSLPRDRDRLTKLHRPPRPRRSASPAAG